MNFVLFELACAMQAALIDLVDDYEQASGDDPVALVAARAMIAKAESAGIVARPTEQA